MDADTVKTFAAGVVLGTALTLGSSWFWGTQLFKKAVYEMNIVRNRENQDSELLNKAEEILDDSQLASK